MAIVYNNKQIQHAYYGETPIHQIYLGDQLKWADVGELYGTGRNNSGDLGVGDTTQRTVFTQSGLSNNWVKVACGSYHSLAINSLGELYTYGENDNGQLGLGDTTDRNVPTKVGTSTDWIKVAGGGGTFYGHSFAINLSGELYAWGYNYSSQLGLGDTTTRNVPTRVGEASDWNTIATGWGSGTGNRISAHTLAINSSGELYAWGYNVNGQLGLGDTTDRNVPTKVGTATDWITVACGQLHSLAINSSGELYAWGYNEYKQLGLDDTTDRNTPTRVGEASNWIDISCTAQCSAAINSLGELYMWGRNAYGELGLGDKVTRGIPTKVGSAANWVSIACGHGQSLAYNSLNQLYAWGSNGYGELGLNDKAERLSPTLVGTYSTIFDVSAGQYHSSVIKL
jgi:alpha-tubulin suppressor-like RCC1 family protein